MLNTTSSSYAKLGRRSRHSASKYSSILLRNLVLLTYKIYNRDRVELSSDDDMNIADLGDMFVDFSLRLPSGFADAMDDFDADGEGDIDDNNDGEEY